MVDASFLFLFSFGIENGSFLWSFYGNFLSCFCFYLLSLCTSSIHTNKIFAVMLPVLSWSEVGLNPKFPPLPQPLLLRQWLQLMFLYKLLKILPIFPTYSNLQEHFFLNFFLLYNALILRFLFVKRLWNFHTFMHFFNLNYLFNALYLSYRLVISLLLSFTREKLIF